MKEPMPQLIQVVKGVDYVHGAGTSVSSLIEHYYKNRQHFGAMFIIGDKGDGKIGILATMGDVKSQLIASKRA